MPCVTPVLLGVRGPQSEMKIIKLDVRKGLPAVCALGPTMPYVALALLGVKEPHSRRRIIKLDVCKKHTWHTCLRC